MNTRSKTILVISFFIFVIAVFFLTRLWFTTDGKIILGNELGKDDWLSFWGAYIGFVGTSTLSIVTLIINLRLHEVNKKLTEHNAISNFYSDIQPIKIEYHTLSEKEMLFPIDGKYGQILESIPSTKKYITNAERLRITFKNIRPFLPNIYHIISINIEYIDNATQTNQNSHVVAKDNGYYSFVRHNSEEIILVSHIIIKDEEKEFWNKINKTEEIRIKLKIIFINPFRILTDAHIGIDLVKNISNNGLFKIQNVFIYECNFSYNSKLEKSIS